jgi:hypothetical protein
MAVPWFPVAIGLKEKLRVLVSTHADFGPAQAYALPHDEKIGFLDPMTSVKPLDGCSLARKEICIDVSKGGKKK